MRLLGSSAQAVLRIKRRRSWKKLVQRAEFREAQYVAEVEGWVVASPRGVGEWPWSVTRQVQEPFTSFQSAHGPAAARHTCMQSRKARQRILRRPASLALLLIICAFEDSNVHLPDRWGCSV